MSFVNRLLLIVPSFGQPIQNDSLFLKAGTALSTTSAQTTSLTGLAPVLRDGWVRVKIYGAGGTTPTLVSLQVIVTDGTTYAMIGLVNPTTAIALGTAVAGTQLATNGSITSGTAVLTSTSNPFTSLMVGAPIAVSGAGTAGATLITTVLSFQNSGQVTLATNAGTTVSGSATITLLSYYINGGVLGTSVGGVDFLFPFLTDLAINQVSLITTLGGSTPTAFMDAEVAATN